MKEQFLQEWKALSTAIEQLGELICEDNPELDEAMLSEIIDVGSDCQKELTRLLFYSVTTLLLKAENLKRVN